MIFNPDIEQLPVEGLRKLQSDRLITLVNRLNRTVPFYRHLWNAEGIDLNQIKNIEDLPLLPFTTKSDLRDNYPYGLFAVPLDRLSRIHASSGTTGKPTVVGYTKNDLNIFDEVVARSLVCAGARPGMKLHNAYGYGLFTGGLGMHGGATCLGMAVIPVSGGMTDRQVTILKDFQPEVICCTPSYALTLSEACKARGIDPETLMVKYAVLGAEPWTETMRQQVESGLGVSATNIYGLSEIIGPGVSQECEEEKGTGSHIWEDHFFPEVVDPETGAPLPYGEEGVLVLSTLTKEAFPLIRYWTNDICSIYYDSESKRSHIKMSPIKGRADDMLIVRGVNLYPTQVEELLGNFQFLSGNYQIVVDRKGTLDRVGVKVELLEDQSDIVDQKALTYKVGLNLKQHLGLTIEVEISHHGSIPRSEGGKLNRILDKRLNQ
jgi:phenylacetate-CoA ligase